MTGMSAALAEHFGTMEDPRAGHLTDYPLLDVLTPRSWTQKGWI
jgi:hypothetical protein